MSKIDKTKDMTPGSKMATEAGCTCPIEKNNYGNGVAFQDMVTYYISADCPLNHTKEFLHGARKEINLC